MPNITFRSATTARTGPMAANSNPTRYDLVATALGGHGELVRSAAELPARSNARVASGKPAVINVMIESIPSPVLRRG